MLIDTDYRAQPAGERPDPSDQPSEWYGLPGRDDDGHHHPAPGTGCADVPAILAANKEALISGLQGFQPTDQTTLTWRDQLVAALQASDFTTAAAKVSELATSGIALAQC
jgi:sugar phosphate isomerase/epimerase